MREEMDFGTALDRLKDGARVTREGWNGVGMWLMMASSVDARTEFGTMSLSPFIIMKTVDSSFVPWTPSTLDLLSTDWVEVA